MSLPDIYLYLDLDGVLADFDKKCANIFNLNLNGLTLRQFFENNPGSKKSLNFWKRLKQESSKISIFEDLEKTFECDSILEAVKNINFKEVNILSATGCILNSDVGKTNWVAKNVSSTLNISNIMLSRTGATKHLMCGTQEGLHVLIDDTPENVHNWSALSDSHLAFLHDKDSPEKTILFIKSLCKMN